MLYAFRSLAIRLVSGRNWMYVTQVFTCVTYIQFLLNSTRMNKTTHVITHIQLQYINNKN